MTSCCFPAKSTEEKEYKDDDDHHHHLLLQPALVKSISLHHQNLHSHKHTSFKPTIIPPKTPKITQTMKLSFPFFFFFFLQITLVFSATSLPFQLQSLLSLKTSLRDPLSSLRDWDPALTFSKSDFQDPVWCTWSGIKCHPDTAQITHLDLSHRNLSGMIPPEIKYLSNLLLLNLSGNNFNGPLQAAIFELSELRTFDISHNNFNSTFPPGISKLKFLRIFSGYSNSFVGPLPEELALLQYLEQLNLGGSYFYGAVPVTYGQFPRLKFMCLAGNLLLGSIPPQLGNLSQLERMEIGYNSFSGFVPSEFSSLVMLKYLDIASANLSGNLPRDLGNLASLETLLLFRNQITGEIPESFSSLKALKVLDLSDNQLSGGIPEKLGNLKELTQLSLMDNHLSGEISEAFGELPNLDTLFLWNNSLTGILPQKLGTNKKLQKLDVSSNFLTGPIPSSLCNGNKLFKLILFSNKFVNALPVSLANCTSLSRFRVQDNQLNGSIPTGFGLLPNLTFVDMSSNDFSGEIPPDFANAVKLEYFNISNNSFNTSLPESIWNSSSLQIFSASSAQITGKIPDFIGCKSVYKIELHDNFLNSSVPWTIGHCEKLLSINLSRNSLSGIIPWEISTLAFITAVDLSHNFLTGSIPSNFQNCSTLETFNVSYNLLIGPVPSSGLVFPNLQPSSFFGNEGLCGVVLAKPCGTPVADVAIEERPSQPHHPAGAIMWIMAAAFGIGLFLLVAGTRCFKANYGRSLRADRGIGSWKITAFQRLNFTADDVLECLSTTDKIIGMGSTGVVYKAEMPSGEIIAVKKLWGKNKDPIIQQRGALVEVDLLGNVRHRNIVRLLGCCSNMDCTMLLYEYMPNGNLEDLLHGKNKDENLTADWVTRYKIALGVAQGICYLHHDCDPPIVHRDLKPSNILLDGEMDARVADFGVAKLIERHESMSVIAGSYGYIAPEYAYTLQVDEKSDIYSYGVVLLEILSGKRSVDSEFGDGNSIVDWVRSKIKVKDGIVAILDKNAGASCSFVREEMIQMLRIALLCTSRNPAERPSMRDVVLMLQEAKPKRKLPESGVAAGNACGGGRENGVSGRRGSSDGDILLAQKPGLDC